IDAPRGAGERPRLRRHPVRQHAIDSADATDSGNPPVSLTHRMRIGILGSGLMGGKLGTLFARAGHEVIFSYSRSERKLQRLAREARGSARAGTPAEAVRHADAVLLAVHWSRLDAVLKPAGGLAGTVAVSCP